MNRISSLQHLANIRLRQQQLWGTAFSEPGVLVSWFGAMQAQDYAQVRWALGIRVPSTTDDAISSIVDAGQIIRTHVLRPTWHLIAAEDIRWMLELSAPGVNAMNKGTISKIGLTPAVFSQSHAIVEKSLTGGQHLTRSELLAALAQSGIHPNPIQAVYLMMQAELDGIVCSGAMRGKQFTYALLDERIPNPRRFTRPEALAMLARRYFQSHGPATVHDFIWWSGLPTADAKSALEAIKADFVNETINQQTYWMASDISTSTHANPQMHLLPGFDEYIIAYKNRDAVIDPAIKHQVILSNGIFKPVVVLNGQVVGVWQRSLKTNEVMVEISLFFNLTAVEKELLVEKVKQLGCFLDRVPKIQFVPS